MSNNSTKLQTSRLVDIGRYMEIILAIQLISVIHVMVTEPSCLSVFLSAQQLADRDCQ